MDEEQISFFEMFEEEGPQPWLITFADMISLLMCMFVLLFSLSSMNEKKFHEIMYSVQKSLAGLSAATRAAGLRKSGEGVFETSGSEAVLPDNAKLLADLKEFAAAEKAGRQIAVSVEGGRVILNVEGQMIFASGEIQLDAKAIPLLDEIIRIIKEHPDYRVNIKGHTDNIPISTPQVPSNWELSALRATTVLRYLLSKGIAPNRLTATGYADLLPVAPNDTEENRAKNRRVEFVLEKEAKR